MSRQSGAMTAGRARQLLDLPSGADADAVSRAFRAAVKLAHPDQGGDPERLRQILEAHKLLKSLSEARLAFTPAQRDSPPPPRRTALQISIQEALFGGRRRLALTPERSLDVRLPEGLRAGDVLRLADAEGQGADVLVRITIAGEPGMHVRGHDLVLEVTAVVDQLDEGERLEVETPRGRRALAAPKAIADGGKVRLKGEGLPARGRHPSGDLILKLTLPPPADEPASRKLLRRFSARWAA